MLEGDLPIPPGTSPRVRAAFVGAYAADDGLYLRITQLNPEGVSMHWVQVDPADIPQGAHVHVLREPDGSYLAPFEVGDCAFASGAFCRYAGAGPDGEAQWEDVSGPDVPAGSRVWHFDDQCFMSEADFAELVPAPSVAAPPPLPEFRSTGLDRPEIGMVASDGHVPWRCGSLSADGTPRWERIRWSAVPVGTQVWHVGQRRFCLTGPVPESVGSYAVNERGYWKMARYSADGSKHWVRVFKPPQGKLVYDYARGGWIKIPYRLTPTSCSG
ncbi:MAG: hypothetical protein M3140_07860 [Actinomycetota bacterium]|nr:hypothetical protein [Actinomycetota bacterium]